MEYEKKPISALLRSSKTVFTLKDLALYWNNSNQSSLIAGVSYYIKTGQLKRIRRGVYVKDENYSKLEAGTRIYVPAYISFETVLGIEGVTFQYYGQIFIASYLSREIKVDNQKYVYRKMKEDVLLNSTGVINTGNYSIATKERAFLDVLYLNTDYHFDNLSSMNWEKVYEILPIYGGNKRMAKKVKIFQEAENKNLR
jgi:predicted transcriptional regulator of viral defense system